MYTTIGSDMAVVISSICGHVLVMVKPTLAPGQVPMARTCSFDTGCNGAQIEPNCICMALFGLGIDGLAKEICNGLIYSKP